MKLPVDIEREIQLVEADYASRGGQQAGNARLRGLRSAIEAELRTKAEAGKVFSAMTPDERVSVFRAWRMIEGPSCEACHGSGKRVYGSTSTWMGGIGGAAMTTDVCDRCWGSGTQGRKGADLRILHSELDQLRRRAAPQPPPNDKVKKGMG